MVKTDTWPRSRLLLWLVVPLAVAAAVYAVACVPLFLPPLPDGFTWGEDPIVPRVPLLRYLELRLHPLMPLTGAT